MEGSSKSELAGPMALLLLSLLELSLLALELALLLLLFSRIEVECSVAALCELAVCLLLEVITGLAAGDDNMIRLVAI